MSGNFWKSSQYQQWLLDPQDILLNRLKEMQLHNLKEDEYYKLMIFFTNLIQSIGEQLRVRQQVIASAIVYFRRFYAKYSLKSIDPFLLAPTCLFLATKVEEFGLQSQQRFSTIPASILKSKFSHLYPQDYPYKIQNIWECEFYLLECLDCCLILYHPYRPLIQFISDLSLDDTQLLQTAWRIANDSLRTDACLMYPPSLIALASLHLACVFLKKDVKQWFSELNVDLEKILEITRHILYLYDLMKTYDEKDQMKDIINRLVKPKTNTPASSSSSSQQNPQASSSSSGSSGSVIRTSSSQQLQTQIQQQQQQQQQVNKGEQPQQIGHMQQQHHMNMNMQNQSQQIKTSNASSTSTNYNNFGPFH